jgi:hypothetical protein
MSLSAFPVFVNPGLLWGDLFVGLSLSGCLAGIKKGPRRPYDQRIASFADGLPAPGDAPPKYDNKISHDGLA